MSLLFQNWLRRSARSTGQSSSQKLRNKKATLPRLEPLEERLAPVAGATAEAMRVAPGGLYDGVVSLHRPSNPLPAPFCTGSLLSTGRHILTAAHCVDFTGDGVLDGPIRVKFDLGTPASPRLVTVDVPATVNHQLVHVGWNGNVNNGNDLAILKLTDPEATPAQHSRHLVAPFGAQRYQLYTGADETSRTFTVVGYGNDGRGASGEFSGTTGVKRQGNNRFETGGERVRNEVQLVDFGCTPTSGFFNIKFGPTHTMWMPHDASPAMVQSFLEALPNIGAGNVSVSRVMGAPPFKFFVEFRGALAGMPAPHRLTLVRYMAGCVDTENHPAKLLIPGALQAPTSGTLAYDFDSADPRNEAFGLLYSLDHPGFGSGEGFLTGGDSGGPNFLGDRIAGVTSYSLHYGPDGDPPDASPGSTSNRSFGELGFVARMSSFGSWVSATVAGSHDLVLDMTKQPMGGDGTADTINARRNGANLELWVGDPAAACTDSRFCYSAPVASIASLTIRGSSDTDTIRIDGRLGIANIRVDGKGGTDKLLVTDENHAGGDTYTVTGTNIRIQRHPTTITFWDDTSSGVEQLELITGTGNDTVTIQTTPIDVPVTIRGGAGNDAFELLDQGTNSLLSLQGEDGNDTINVRKTVATSPVTVLGGLGDDTVNIGSTDNKLTQILGAVTVHGEGGTDTLNLNDQGWNGVPVYTITATTVAVTAVATTTYGTLENLTLNAAPGTVTLNVQGTATGTTTTLNCGAGNNTINVGSAANTLTDLQGPLTVNGQGGADTLNLNDQGWNGAPTYTLTATSVAVTGVATTTHTGVETLVLNAGLGTVTINVLATAAAVATTINAGAGNSTINVGSAANTLTNILGALTINGQGGNDTLNLNDQGWNGTPTYTLTASTVAVTGVATIAYGTIETLTLNAGSGGVTINVVATGTTTIINSGGGNDTITVQATGAATTVNAGGGNDTINVGSAGNTLTNILGLLSINGQGGTDTLNFNDQGWNGAPTYTVTASSVAATGVATTTYSGVETLILNAGWGNVTVNVQGTAAPTVTTINAGAGNDTINVGSTTNMLTPILGLLTVNGQGGTDTLNFNDQGWTGTPTYTIDAASVAVTGVATTTYGTIETLVLNGGLGGTVTNVLATAAGVAYTVNAGAGNDTIHIGSGGPPPTASTINSILGAVTVNGQGGTDTLNINDQSNAAGARTYTITANGVTRTGAPVAVAAVTYGTLENLTVNGSSSYVVQSTAAGVNTTLNAGTGNDTIDVGSGGPNSTLAGIQGPLTINGQGGTDTLSFHDQGRNGMQTYTLTATTLAVTGLATTTFGTIENLTLNAGSGDVTINVQATAAGIATTINAGTGNGTINVGSAANTLTPILGLLTVNGQGGTDTLNFNDQGLAASPTYTLTAATLAVTGGVATTTFGTIENLTLNAGTGTVLIHVQATAASVVTTINAGTGNGTINVGSTTNTLLNIQGALNVNGQGGTDTLNFNDQGWTGAPTYTLTDTTLAATGIATTTYGTIENLTLNAGTGGHTITVQSRAAATATTVNAGSGSSNLSVRATTGALTINGQGGLDQVTVGYLGSARQILGNVTLTNATGRTGLTVENGADPFARSPELTSSRLLGLAPADINWTPTQLLTLTITMGSGSDVFTVSSTPAGPVTTTLNLGGGDDTLVVLQTSGSLTVNGGSGDDLFVVGGTTTGTLAGIQGAATFNGDAGYDILVVLDQDNVSANRAYTVTPTTITRTGGVAVLTHGTMDFIWLATSNLADTITLTGVPAPALLYVDGGLGSDTLIGPNVDMLWYLSAMNEGVFFDATTYDYGLYVGVENLTCGSGADYVLFGGDGTGLSGGLAGGGGINTLDYSIHTTDVVVNLTLLTASGIGGPLSGIRNVTGGAGNDILVGDVASNTLSGGPGRNVLIGGGSATVSNPDILLGGDGEDILIAGWTTYDGTAASLAAIRTMWVRTDLSYTQRVNNLRDGAGVPRLDATTVFSNRAANVLLGGAGLDLFFARLAYDYLDYVSGTERFFEIT